MPSSTVGSTDTMSLHRHYIISVDAGCQVRGPLECLRCASSLPAEAGGKQVNMHGREGVGRGKGVPGVVMGGPAGLPAWEGGGLGSRPIP